MSEAQRDGNLPITSFTLIKRIRSLDSAISDSALNEFCSRYWLPLYGVLRSSGEKHEDAADLVQGFIAKELLERELLSGWRPEKGSLRAFLKTCLLRFRSNAIRSETSKKRGGKKWATHLSLDFEWAESHFDRSIMENESPDRRYDREWAAAVVNEAALHLAQRYQAEGKDDAFRLLLLNLDERGENEATLTYERIGVELGCSIDSVKKRMITFRSRFEQSLRAVVGDQIGQEQAGSDVEYLLSLLSE